MLRKIRGRISPATVIAMIALFAALGGGYATAFSGSGSLQKENEKGISTSGYETIRSLTGIGALRAKCSGGDVTLNFRNTSGKDLWVDVDNGGVNPTSGDELPGNGSSRDIPAGIGTSQPDALRIHAYPDNGSKRPQVDLTVAVRDSGSDCQIRQVAVMALNTEG